MRRARFFPMIAVGLASLVGQTIMPQECRSWDYLPKDLVNPPADSEGVIIDSSVEQAGFYDSRPRPTSGQFARPVRKSAAPVESNGALYRGQKLKMPSLPFGRPSAQEQTSQRVAPANMPSTAPWGATAGKQRTPQAAANASNQMPQRMPAGMPTGMPINQAGRVASRPAPPLQQSPAPRTASAPRPMPQQPAAAVPAASSSNTVPWSKQPLSAPTAKPTQKPVTSAPAKPAAPMSAADRLIAEAHAMSTAAQTDAEYTQVIATCRRALASEASAETTQFAQNLIAWSFNRRGQLKAEAGQDNAAILDFDDAIRADANCWRALHNRGVLLAQAGQFEKAFEDFSQTIELNPKFAKAYSNRAALYMVADDKLANAYADYKQAIALDNSLAVAHRGCGRVCQLSGKIDEAVAHYDAAVSLAPDDSYAAACRADLLTDVGRYAEAAAEYDRALQLDPQSIQALGGLAWLLATCPDSSVRNPRIAVDQAKAVIQAGGEKDAVNFDTLAAAQASAGDFSGAMDSVRRAIQLAPADERDAYRDRLNLYQKAKPYRIAPIERMAKQVSYETNAGVEGAAR